MEPGSGAIPLDPGAKSPRSQLKLKVSVCFAHVCIKPLDNSAPFGIMHTSASFEQIRDRTFLIPLPDKIRRPEGDPLMSSASTSPLLQMVTTTPTDYWNDSCSIES